VSWLEAIVLGVLQGLTEFLPVSSSAHLRIAGPFLPSGGDPGAAFTAITQIGTEVAVLVYFRRDLARIGSSGARADPRGVAPRWNHHGRINDGVHPAHLRYSCSAAEKIAGPRITLFMSLLRHSPASNK
jgi:hypothetical protein